MTRRMFTVPEAAEVLRVSPTLLYRLCRDGDIPHRRLGARVLIPAGVVDDLCNDPTSATASPAADPGFPPGRDEPAGGALGAVEPTGFEHRAAGTGKRAAASTAPTTKQKRPALHTPSAS